MSFRIKFLMKYWTVPFKLRFLKSSSIHAWSLAVFFPDLRVYSPLICSIHAWSLAVFFPDLRVYSSLICSIYAWSHTIFSPDILEYSRLISYRIQVWSHTEFSPYLIQFSQLISWSIRFWSDIVVTPDMQYSRLISHNTFLWSHAVFAPDLIEYSWQSVVQTEVWACRWQDILQPQPKPFVSPYFASDKSRGLLMSVCAFACPRNNIAWEKDTEICLRKDLSRKNIL
jgi:hypothetical protein